MDNKDGDPECMLAGYQKKRDMPGSAAVKLPLQIDGFQVDAGQSNG